MARIFMNLIWITKFSFTFQSLTTRKIPKHQCIMEHEASRSYQPSNTGIAAYYQADGLALRLPRVPSTHHLHGESPAEEVQSNLHFTESLCSRNFQNVKLRLDFFDI